MENVLITSDGIQKNLKHIKPTNAICEYIWNGFDAGATEIKISFHRNKLEIIDAMTIQDNGMGINFDELNQKFQPYNDSEKFRERETASHHSLPHGKNGVGRLTFFVFSNTATWRTVYKSNDKMNLTYSIKMDRDALNSYNPNDNEKPTLTKEAEGTCVSFSQVNGLYEDEIIQAVKNEFFWFVELNRTKKCQIFIEDKSVDFSSVEMERKTLDISNFKLKNDFEVTIVQWKVSLGKEYSKYYFINSKSEEVYKENTTLNKKSDNFYHSVFIKSQYFDTFSFEEIGDNQLGLFPVKSDLEYKILIEAINRVLLEQRKIFLKKDSNKFIDKLVEKKIYPEFNRKSIVDTYRKQQLNDIIETLYTTEPKIFTGLNVEQQKIFIRLLNMVMDSNERDSFFNIIHEVIELDDEELKELSEVLSYTSLSNMTKTIKLIEDRLKAVQQLKELVFNKHFNALEVPHIQAMVEDHYWLFGEQYHLLTSAEPDFSEALRRLVYAQTGDADVVTIDHEDVNKEMDIFMIRQNKEANYIENVVVELKRPSIPLGEAQLSQVKKYLRVIQSDDRFNSANSKWTYYLIGNKLNSNGFMQGELRSHENLGERNIVHKDGNHKVFVLTWSEIFEQFSIKHTYLLDKLKITEKLWLEKHNSADEVISDSKGNSAKLDLLAVPAKA